MTKFALAIEAAKAVALWALVAVLAVNAAGLMVISAAAVEWSYTYGTLGSVLNS